MRVGYGCVGFRVRDMSNTARGAALSLRARGENRAESTLENGQGELLGFPFRLANVQRVLENEGDGPAETGERGNGRRGFDTRHGGWKKMRATFGLGENRATVGFEFRQL